MATPIGNLGDLTPRAAAILAGVDLIACEDTRVTGRLLAHLGLRRPMRIYNDHTGARLRPHLLEQLRCGRSVALVTDAGTPCISDPGYKLVREAQAAGIAVRAVPGPSAAIAALSIAGLPTDRFFFMGFLPPRTAARRARLEAVAALDATLVLLESGPRLAALLADASAVLGPREAAIARELTKIHEEVRRGPLAELAAALADEPPPKGEIVLLVGPPAATGTLDAAEVDGLLLEALAHQPPRKAAAAVGSRTGRSTGSLYERILELKRAAEDR